MKQAVKAELREERKKGAGKKEENYDDSEGSDSLNEEDIVMFIILIRYLDEIL